MQYAYNIRNLLISLPQIPIRNGVAKVTKIIEIDKMKVERAKNGWALTGVGDGEMAALVMFFTATRFRYTYSDTADMCELSGAPLTGQNEGFLREFQAFAGNFRRATGEHLVVDGGGLRDGRVIRDDRRTGHRAFVDMPDISETVRDILLPRDERY
jgi:hypothetical protein